MARDGTQRLDLLAIYLNALSGFYVGALEQNEAFLEPNYDAQISLGCVNASVH
jgi:hypothetical protein